MLNNAHQAARQGYKPIKSGHWKNQLITTQNKWLCVIRLKIWSRVVNRSV